MNTLYCIIGFNYEGKPFMDFVENLGSVVKFMQDSRFSEKGVYAISSGSSIDVEILGDNVVNDMVSAGLDYSV